MIDPEGLKGFISAVVAAVGGTVTGAIAGASNDGGLIGAATGAASGAVIGFVTGYIFGAPEGITLATAGSAIVTNFLGELSTPIELGYGLDPCGPGSTPVIKNKS
jgi:hypothetical protein